MFYYVVYEGTTPVGFIQSPAPKSVRNAVEVSKEEFISLGSPILIRESPKIETLEAMIKAQSDRAEFIEDCIAEMAEQVYGGV